MGLAGFRFLGFGTVTDHDADGHPTTTRYEVADFRTEGQGGMLNVLRGGAAITVIDGRLERRFLVGEDDPSSRMLLLLEQLMGNVPGTGVTRPDVIRALVTPPNGDAAGQTWTRPGDEIIRTFANAPEGTLEGTATLRSLGSHAVGERSGQKVSIALELPTVVVRTSEGPRETTSYVLSAEVFFGEDFVDYTFERSFVVTVTDARGQDTIPVTYTTTREVTIRDQPDRFRPAARTAPAPAPTPGAN